MTDEAREAAWAEFIALPRHERVQFESAFDAGVVEGQRQARETVLGGVDMATLDLTDDNLREWAQQIWGAVEYDAPKAVRTMRSFIEDYERNRHE